MTLFKITLWTDALDDSDRDHRHNSDCSQKRKTKCAIKV